MKNNVKLNSDRWLSLENLENEIWKDVVDYEGIYKISNYGRILSLSQKIYTPTKNIGYSKEKIMKVSLNHCGYVTLRLSKNGKRKGYMVHRLVMYAFVGKNILQVNHKNEIKTDNRLENLEYMTNQENCRYSTAKKIIALNLKDNTYKIYDCIQDVRQDGFNQSNVISVLKNKRNYVKNYTFYYMNKNDERHLS